MEAECLKGDTLFVCYDDDNIHMITADGDGELTDE